MFPPLKLEAETTTEAKDVPLLSESDFEEVDHNPSLLSYNETGWTVLHQIAAEGDAARLQALTTHPEFKQALELPSRAIASTGIADQYTPLHVAVLHFPVSADVIKILLLKGASLSTQDSNGQNALHLALHYDIDSSLLHLLVDKRLQSKDLTVAWRTVDALKRTPRTLSNAAHVPAEIQKAIADIGAEVAFNRLFISIKPDQDPVPLLARRHSSVPYPVPTTSVDKKSQRARSTSALPGFPTSSKKEEAQKRSDATRKQPLNFLAKIPEDTVLVSASAPRSASDASLQARVHSSLALRMDALKINPNFDPPTKVRSRSAPTTTPPPHRHQRTPSTGTELLFSEGARRGYLSPLSRNPPKTIEREALPVILEDAPVSAPQSLASVKSPANK